MESKKSKKEPTLVEESLQGRGGVGKSTLSPEATIRKKRSELLE